MRKRREPFYEQIETRGQRSTPLGVYFRTLLVGYFEGIDSQRGIAWWCSDSLPLREFLGIRLDEGSPDHSTLSLTRRQLPVEVFEEVFQLVLKIGLPWWKCTRRNESLRAEYRQGDESMAKRGGKRHSREQIVHKLRDGDAMLNAGKSVAEVVP